MSRRTRRLPAAAVAGACCWLAAAAVGSTGEPPTTVVSSEDTAAGAQAFLVCKACHSAEPGGAARIGPNLWNVVGRGVASVAGFDYSAPLRAIGGHWTPELLDRFLADPSGLAPGTRMGLPGIADPGERARLIAYLETLHDGAPSIAAAPSRDFGPDWPQGPGSAEAGALCDSCHSLSLVKQQRLSRQTWDRLLLWMVEEQGMAEQTPETRELILGYLAEHFGAPDAAR